jgi:hypothetical protein
MLRMQRRPVLWAAQWPAATSTWSVIEKRSDNLGDAAMGSLGQHLGVHLVSIQGRLHPATDSRDAYICTVNNMTGFPAAIEGDCQFAYIAGRAKQHLCQAAWAPAIPAS